MNAPNDLTLDARNLVDEDAAVEDLIRDDYEFLTETLGFDPFADTQELEETDLAEVTVLDAILSAEQRFAREHDSADADECDIGRIVSEYHA